MFANRDRSAAHAGIGHRDGDEPGAGPVRAHRPAEAVAVLEKAILYVNGNESFLALMKSLHRLVERPETVRQRADRIDHVRRQLRILAPNLNVDEILAQAAAPVAPAPMAPAPMAPAPVAPSPVAPAPVVAALLLRRRQPIQRPPRRRQRRSFDSRPMKTHSSKRRSIAWRRPTRRAKPKRLSSKSTTRKPPRLYQQAVKAGLTLNAEERQAWGYCRLHDVVTRLNRGGDLGSSLAAMQKEAEEAMQLGG